MESAKQYTWDVDTRLKRLVDAMTGPVDFGHDAFGNLANVAHADGHIELRLPDALGNLFRTHDRSDRRYGPGGQLLETRDARGITRFEYDQEGNLISKIEPDGATWTYAWNSAGMLAEVTRPDGGLVELRYDALGRRISKKFRDKVTRWVWDGNVPLHEWVELHAAEAEPASSDAPTRSNAVEALRARARRALLHARPAQGPPPEASRQDPPATEVGPVTTWVFSPEGYAPLAKIVERSCFSIVTDQLGAPTAMFDAGGREIWAGQLDSYGALRNQRGERAACPFRWPGQYEDEETGLYYNRFRYYDPEAGRYVSQDPIRLRGGPNLYAYVPDVLTHVDPWGLSGCRDVSTEPDTAFFWSGRTDGIGGQNIAAEIAQARGGTTLEMLLENRKIDMPPWDANDPAVVKAWNDISADYAKSVQGHVRAVIGESLRPGNVWETSELGNLMSNPNVTKITTIDPKTMVEKVIFVR